jgi:cytochrome P450
MLDEMRRIALLILVKSAFAVDMLPDLERLVDPIVQTIRYISPGLWIMWPQMPRPGYRAPIAAVDAYLYSLIAERRRQLQAGQFREAEDLLSVLVRNPKLDDRLVHDQMLTMLIAGHDTSTALLAWTLYLITRYPQVQNRLLVELDAAGPVDDYSKETLDSLSYLDCVIKESLRLYPPIHVGNRIVNKDIEIDGYSIPAGTRLMHSIYLTHRDPRTWNAPDAFIPERFERENRRQIRSYSYAPFGAGPRMCIGAAFAQVESKTILAYLLRTFTFTSVEDIAGPHMGATLEPAPGVQLRVHRRRRYR